MSQTPEERILAMKKRAEESANRKEQERQREQRRAFAATDERDRLVKILSPLNDLPLLPNGVAKITSEERGDGMSWDVAVFRRGWDEDHETVNETRTRRIARS